MESKRRRVDNDYGAAQPTASTSRALAANGSKQSTQRNTIDSSRAYNNQQQQYIPVLNLASLPPAALQRYLSRYNLIEPHGTLSYHNAVFPVPPLPAEIVPPLSGRTLLPRRPRPSDYDGDNSAAEGTASKSKKRVWVEPKTSEFAELTAFDEPKVVVERLAERARAHWDKKDSVKEGETLTNFIFSLRMRAHTLRATPPG